MSTFNFFGVTLQDDGESSLKRLREKCLPTESISRWCEQVVNSFSLLPVCGMTFPTDSIEGALSKLKDERILDRCLNVLDSVTLGRVTGRLMSRINHCITLKDDKQPSFINTKAQAQAFATYVTHLFTDRFKDRNGVILGLKSKVLTSAGKELADIAQHGLADNTDMDSSLIVASRLVSIMTEYAGDTTFKVPFYAPELLDVEARIEHVQREMNRLAQEHAELNQPSSDWDIIVKKQALERLGVRCQLAKMQLECLSSLASHPEADPRPSFTCFKAGLITNHIEGIKLNGNGKDYSALVGKLIAMGARATAETVKSAVGAAIRGGSFFDLDNELIAEVIATLAAALAKKFEEHAAYEFLCEFITKATFNSLTFPGGETITKAELLEFLDQI